MSDLNDIWNSGNSKLPEDKLLAYLEGRLSPEEQRAVEAMLSEEGMESDALEGLKELHADETRQLVSGINQKLQSSLRAKPKRRAKPIGANMWVLVAIALILLLALLGYWVLHTSINR